MREHWPLIGRDEESRVIAELLDGDVYRGVAVAGRAGIGKSRLAREAVSAATGLGWSVRQVVGTATGRSIPLGAFARWADDAEGAPLTLARRVIRTLSDDAGTGGRLLIFVDDAHLLDELSALVIHQLVMRRAAAVILTIRSGQPVPDAIASLWKDRLLRRLELQPLSAYESAELLESVLGLPPDADCADRMWRLTAGNVLFLQQLVVQERGAGRLVLGDGRCRWLGSPELSPSLVELVENQIGTIADEVRDVVDLVAVAEPVEWIRLCGLVDQLALEEAEQRELIRTSGGTVHIGHPMYAEVRLNQCGPIRLRRLRGQVARAMKGGGAPAELVRRGLLWLESDLAPDPEVLTSAAAAASAMLDFDLATRLSRAAEESGVGAEARVQLAYNLVLSQQGRAAETVIDGIADDGVSDTDFVNGVVLRAANLLWNMRSPEESWRVIDDALARTDGPRSGQLLAFRANQLMLAVRPAEIVDMIDTVDYGPLDVFGEAVRLCCETYALAELGRTAEAIATAGACRRILGSAPQHGSYLGEARIEFHAFALAVSGRAREAADLANDYRNNCAASPSAVQALAGAVLGSSLLAVGQLREALRWLPSESSSDDPDGVLANSFHRFHLLRTQALARLGDVAAAEEAMRSAEADRHPVYVLVELNALLAEAWLAAARDQLAEARELVHRAVVFTREHGQLAREVLCLQTLVQFGDASGAARLVELADVVEGPRVRAAARYAQAVDRDDAHEMNSVSMAFEAMGDVLAAADAAAHAATAHRRSGRGANAVAAAARARKLSAACGDATSPALVAARGVETLSERESEIAQLVARGLTNRDIANVMSVSVRTVEGHIYRASCKAGVARRSELADMINGIDAPARSA